MNETDKLKARIEALGYNVVIHDAPNTYRRTPPSHDDEVVICSGREFETYDRQHNGHPHTTVSYLHWHDGKPITFFRTRTQVYEKGGHVSEKVGCLEGFEECITWYSKPPKQNGQSTRTNDGTAVD